MSVQALTRRRQRPHRLGRGAVQRAHRPHGFVGQRGVDAIELDRRADEARAERLGEEQHVAGARAGVRDHARRIDGAGHGVAELDFAILHGVAAEQRDAGFAQLVEPAAEDLADRRRARARLSGNAAIASAVSGRPPIA